MAPTSSSASPSTSGDGASVARGPAAEDPADASKSTGSTCFSATTTTRSTSCAGATRRSTAIGRTRRVPSARGTTPSNRRIWSASSTGTTAGGSRGWRPSARSAVGPVVAMRGPRQQRPSPWPTSWSGLSVSWSTSSHRSRSQNHAGVAPSASAPRRGPLSAGAAAPAASVAAVVQGAALIGLTLPLSWAERVLRQATTFTGNQNLERVLPSLIEPVRRSLPRRPALAYGRSPQLRTGRDW